MAKTKEKKEQAEQANANQGKKRSKRKLLLLSLLGLMFLAAAGGLGFWGYQQFLAPEQEESSAENKDQEEQGKKSSENTELVSLPTLLVNLADPMGKRFIKVSIDLEVEDKKAESSIQDNMPRIKDALIMLLSSKSFDQISSMENKMALKGEIVERVNQILGKSVVQEIYFTEFVIQ
ncbi:MAG: flagellar basal body-associated protein FliL [Desulfohalobiaceae bacterium]